MRYTKIGDWDVSVLGFGAAMVRESSNEHRRRAPIDEQASIDLIRYAVDKGINWFDAGYIYAEGHQEVILGKALRDGYRERVHVVTKMPSWLIKTPDDFDRYLDEQLDRLQMNHLDAYLLHGLRVEWWEKLRDLGVIKWAERKMAEGVFKHFGFSVHDQFPGFKTIVDAYDNWSIAIVQYNFMDVDTQVTTQGIEYAAEKDINLFIMEPLRGGQIADKIPPRVESIWGEAPGDHTPADRAMRWLWDRPEIKVVLSGMKAKWMVDQNVASAINSGPGQMSAEEHDIMARVRDAYRDVDLVPCTQCHYCMPCPHGVNIPRVFELYNDALMFDDFERDRTRYVMMLMNADARRCVECGACEEVCPQSIEIIDWLKHAHSIFYPRRKRVHEAVTT